MRHCLVALAFISSIGCGERAKLMDETRAAAEAICACVKPASDVEELARCEGEAWVVYDRAEGALNAAKFDEGPEYAAIHSRRLACQDKVASRQLELTKK